MKTTGWFLFLILSSFLAFPQTAPLRLLVKPKGNFAVVGKSRKMTVRILEQHQLPLPSSITTLVQDSVWLFTFDRKMNGKKILQTYKNSALFAYVEQDLVGHAAGIQAQAPNDPGYVQQWYWHNDGSFTFGKALMGADVQAEKAWEITRGDSTVVVAVMDSGIYQEHREFKNRIWINKNEIPGDQKDNDDNGYIDDYEGWDFVNGDAQPIDDNGHGTAVAGVLGASGDNDFSYTGMNWKCKLMIVKVLDAKLSGRYSHWIEGIRYAVDNGADIINFSIVGKMPSQAMEDAIAYAHSKGVLVVCSMGNTNSSEPYYPAAYHQTLAVGATDPDDQRSIAFNGNPAFGSNTGKHIDVVAPGNYIYGLNASSAEMPGNLWGGTSMATAIVSGVASLLLGEDPSLSPAQLTQIISRSAQDNLGDLSEDRPGWDSFYGFGRVDAFRALTLLEEREFEGEDTPFIYPNPAKDIVNIHLQTSFPETVQATVLNMNGQVMQTVFLSEKETRRVEGALDTSTWIPGIYLIIIKTERKQWVKKLLKI
ncbi:S8 family serine peptidase [Rapidithrix thailandica]|uniref:S8 family serine peptidase n=1 Tax=Rapidithrix thailandica TaxID=413964 RepID=A0AAW9SGX5_9BACT